MLTVQKQWKISKLATSPAAVLFFLRDTVEMEMNEKLSLFRYIVSFLNEKS